MLKNHESILVEQIGMTELGPLFARCSLLEAKVGEVLMRDQQPVDSLYLLLEGRLSLSVEMEGHTILLGDIDPGNWVGEVALFSGSSLAASTVTAVGASKLLRLGFDDFTALVEEAPEVACRLTHILASMMIQRLRASINDPILDPAGQFLMLGDLSLPMPAHHEHHGVRDFFKKLLGVD
jgi:CRP-like cAMP-binding protein